jgi:hypothetical protein
MSSRWGTFGAGRDTSRSKVSTDTRQQVHSSDQQEDSVEDPNGAGHVLPWSLSSWVIGVCNGEEYAWFMEYINTAVFQECRKQFRSYNGWT